MIDRHLIVLGEQMAARIDTFGVCRKAWGEKYANESYEFRGQMKFIGRSDKILGKLRGTDLKMSDLHLIGNGKRLYFLV